MTVKELILELGKYPDSLEVSYINGEFEDTINYLTVTSVKADKLGVYLE